MDRSFVVNINLVSHNVVKMNGFGKYLICAIISTELTFCVSRVGDHMVSWVTTSSQAKGTNSTSFLTRGNKLFCNYFQENWSLSRWVK